MTDNIKIRTEDVLEILDNKILASSDHTQLAVVRYESYDSVLKKIADRSPNIYEKAALDASAWSLQTTGTLVSGSSTLSALASTAGVAVGNIIAGANIPTGTYVTSVGTNSVTMSVAATGSATETVTFMFAPALSTTGTVVLGSKNLTLPTTIGVAVGNVVVGAGIPVGTSITSITDNVTAVMSASATANATGLIIFVIGPSSSNPYITLTQLNTQLAGKVAWHTVGLPGSGADYEGVDETPFQAAIGAGVQWIMVQPGVYTFTNSVTLPSNVYLSGSSPHATTLRGSCNPVVGMSLGTQISYITVAQTGAAGSAINLQGDRSTIWNCVLSSTATANCLSGASGLRDIKVWESGLLLGSSTLTSLQNSTFHGLYLDCPGVKALTLASPTNVSLTTSIFSHGQFSETSATNCRVVGNHFHDGVVEYPALDPNILYRANTPATYNNEDAEFSDLLQYVGSPSPTATIPDYTNDFGGSGLTAFSFHQQIGSPTQNEVQIITPSSTPVGGSFTLTWNGNSSGMLQYNATASMIQTYFRSIVGIDPACTVTGTMATSLTFTFLGTLGLSPQPPVSITSSTLYGSVDDLTTRAGTLDLLIQWRYEERNWHLVAATEPMTVRWDPSTLTLTYGQMNLISSHREAVWTIPAYSFSFIANGYAVYYVIDRTLEANNISLGIPQIAPLGSIPLDNNNRQIYVLAVCVGGTLWWRGGGGSRFPSGNAGNYFVDGKSQSLLSYIGASDYNDMDPNYSDNFTGIQGENLVTRIGKQDTLIRRLYEYSNLGVSLADSAYISWEGGTLTLGATTVGDQANAVWFSMPHVAWRIFAAAQTWTLSNGQFLYFVWDQTTPQADHAVSSFGIVTSGNLPLPNNYPLTTKYFVFARCINGNIYLWNDFEIPPGGIYPLQFGRAVVRNAAPIVLSDNYSWTGTDFLWEGLAVSTSTGVPLARNILTDQTIPSVGLTNLANGQGLLVTHSWNATGTQTPTIAKVSLPYAAPLQQNQFILVQNRGGNIFFIG